MQKQAAPRKKEPARTSDLSVRRVVSAMTVARVRAVVVSALKTQNAPASPAQTCVRKPDQRSHPTLPPRAMAKDATVVVAAAETADATNVANAPKKQPAVRW